MAAPAAVTPGYFSGIDGRVFLDTFEMAITKWSADDSCPMSDRTNSKTKGQQAGTRTVRSLNGSFDCVVPNDATGDPEFEPGNTYPIWLIAHDGRGYNCGAYIESISPSSETTGDLGYTVKFKSNYLGTSTSLKPWLNADLASLPSGVSGQGSAAQGTV